MAVTKDEIRNNVDTEVLNEGLSLKLSFNFDSPDGEPLNHRAVFNYDSESALVANQEKVTDMFIDTIYDLESKENKDYKRSVLKKFLGFKFGFLSVNHEHDPSDTRSYVKIGALELVNYTDSGIPFVFEWKPADGFVLAFGTAGVSKSPITRGVMIIRDKK